MLIKNYRSTVAQPLLTIGLVLKLACGILLGLLYSEYYQSGDTFAFFEAALYYKEKFNTSFKQGIALFFSWQGEEGMNFYIQPRALIVSRFCFLVNLITANNYWITSLYFSLFNYFSILFFIKKTKNTNFYKPALYTLLFLPSFVFWSSGILKESVTIACFFIFLGHYIDLHHSKKIKPVQWIILSVCWIFIYLIKYYVALLLLPIVVASFIAQHQTIIPRYKKLFFLISLSIATLLASLLHPNLNPTRILEVITLNRSTFSPSELNISFSFIEFIKILPTTLIDAFFEPLITGAYNLPSTLASIETSFFILFLSYSIWKILIQRKKLELNLLGFSVVIYISLCAILLSYSTPIIGTISRFRVYYFPLVLILLLTALTDKKSKGRNTRTQTLTN